MTPKIVLNSLDIRILTWHSYLSLNYDFTHHPHYCIGEYGSSFTQYFKIMYDLSKETLRRIDTDIGCNVLRREGLKQVVRKQW